jgi:hypothetical protein
MHDMADGASEGAGEMPGIARHALDVSVTSNPHHKSPKNQKEKKLNPEIVSILALY